VGRPRELRGFHFQRIVPVVWICPHLLAEIRERVHGFRGEGTWFTHPPGAPPHSCRQNRPIGCPLFLRPRSGRGLKMLWLGSYQRHHCKRGRSVVHEVTRAVQIQ
jgi:hypothetical protein